MSEYNPPHDERMKRKQEFNDFTTKVRKTLGINYKKQWEEVGKRYISNEETFRSMRSMKSDKYYPSREFMEDLRRTYGPRLEEKGYKVKRQIITPEQSEIHDLKRRVKKLEQEVESLKLSGDKEKVEGMIKVAQRYLEEMKKEKNNL